VNYFDLTAVKAAEAVNNKEISARHLIENILEHCIDLNKKLNTFTYIAGTEALEHADSVDQKINSGYSMPLAGVPIAIGDNIAYKEMPAGLGSGAFRDYKPPFSAAAVEKLIGAGAVVIGKTNTGDMGIALNKALSPAGPALNPWNINRISESAGAAALAVRQCMLILESDSEGALRQGAATCGVFGLRPTPGRISRYGLNICSGSFDQVGLAAAAVADVSLAFQAVVGYDERDILTSVSRESRVKSEPGKIPNEIKLAFSPESFDLIDPISAEKLSQFRERCSSHGFILVETPLKLLNNALKAFYVITYAETSSTFARFDGIRYGRAAEADNLEDLYYKTRRLTFGHEAQRRSVFGTYLLSKGNFEHYYQQALKVWSLVKQEFAETMSNCDFLVLPTVKSTALKESEDSDFLKLLDEDIFTAPVTMTGLPSLTLPAWRENNFPAGIQLIGHPFSDEMLINIADIIKAEIEYPVPGNSEGEAG